MPLDQLQTSMTIDHLSNASTNVAYNSHNYNVSRGSQVGRGQGRQRGRDGNNFRGRRGKERSNYKPVIQICKKVGHMATTWYFKFDNDYQPPASSQDQHPPACYPTNNSGNSNAYIATSDTIHDSAWYMDSGATIHVTSELDNLSISSDYKGKAKLCVGDGNAFPISHVGSSLIASKPHPLLLNNVLHVP